MPVIDEVREALERTVRDFRARRGDWAGVLASAHADKRDRRESQTIERRHGRGTRALRVIRKRPGRTALALAILAGAAAAALFVSSPWKSSPGFLERAQAALTPPAASVLHYRWEVTRTSTDFGCTVTTGPNEMWIDQTPPYRYRALMTPPGDPQEVEGDDSRTLACAAFGTVEIGGALETDGEVMFVPHTLKVGPATLIAQLDPVTQFRDELREAIGNGTAHHEGKTELDGRAVERIRVDPLCPDPPCPGPGYAYVHPETFAPVQLEIPGGLSLAVFADASSTPSRVLRFDIVVRLLTFEYLPRTAANLALIDIRAERRPGATGP